MTRLEDSHTTRVTRARAVPPLDPMTIRWP